MESTIIKKFTKSVNTLSAESFVFWISTAFYFLLWILNPPNKIIAASFFGLILIIYLRAKDLRLSLLLSYLVSMVIFTGKTYEIQLIPPGIFPKELYPSGYTVFFIISAKHILAFLMLLVLLRDLIRFKFKIIKFTLTDVVITLFFVWQITSDLFASNNPGTSLMFSLISLEALVVYFYLRGYAGRFPNLVRYIFWLFAAIVVFQSAISLQQFAQSSPVYKNLEHQVDIGHFGWAPDELAFRFRPLGTFPHANILASWLAFLLSIILAGFFKKSNYLLVLVSVLGLAVLGMTLSRSSWLGYLASALLILYFAEKINKLVFPKILTKHLGWFLVLAVPILFFLILPRVEKSVYSFVFGAGGGGELRYSQIQDTLVIISRNPVFGVGSFMTVGEALKANPRGIFSLTPITVHNWYLLLTAEHGLPALILFLLFVLLSIKNLIPRIFPKSLLSFKDFMVLGSLGGILAVLISGFFQNFLVLSLILLSIGLFTEENKKGEIA